MRPEDDENSIHFPLLKFGVHSLRNFIVTLKSFIEQAFDNEHEIAQQKRHHHV